MDDRGPVVLAVTAAMLAGSTFFVVLRLLTRYFIVHRIKLDDWLILFAWVRSSILTSLLRFTIAYSSTAHRLRTILLYLLCYQVWTRTSPSQRFGEATGGSAEARIYLLRSLRMSQTPTCSGHKS